MRGNEYMIGKKSLLLLVLALTMVVGGSIITNPSPAQETEPTVIDVDIESVTISEAEALLSYKVYALTYRGMFEEADLVAIVEITGDVKTYYKPWPHTLYKSRVIQTIKGSSSEHLYIYQMDGYDPKYRVFYHLAHDPLLMPGERWLFFLRRQNIRGASHGETFIPNFVSLKLEDGKLHSLDIYNKVVKEILLSDKAFNNVGKAKLGILGLPPMHDRLHVEGLTVEKFIKRISQKK